jgi:hypothetical protein
MFSILTFEMIYLDLIESEAFLPHCGLEYSLHCGNPSFISQEVILSIDFCNHPHRRRHLTRRSLIIFNDYLNKQASFSRLF